MHLRISSFYIFYKSGNGGNRKLPNSELEPNNIQHINTNSLHCKVCFHGNYMYVCVCVCIV